MLRRLHYPALPHYDTNQIHYDRYLSGLMESLDLGNL